MHDTHTYILLTYLDLPRAIPTITIFSSFRTKYFVVLLTDEQDRKLMHIIISPHLCRACRLLKLTTSIWLLNQHANQGGHFHPNQLDDPVFLSFGATTFCLSARSSSTSASSSFTRALASSRYFSCAKSPRTRCKAYEHTRSNCRVQSKQAKRGRLTRYTAEPRRATGTMPGNKSEYHCACGDFAEGEGCWL